MNVMCCAARQPGVSSSCQGWSCRSWKRRGWISRRVCVYFCGNYEQKNFHWVLSIIAEMMPVLRLCVIQHLCLLCFLSRFFFLPFLISAFLRGFTGNCRQIDRKWEVGVCNLYFPEYLCAISHLVSYSGIASFHLKNNTLAVVTYFLKENS